MKPTLLVKFCCLTCTLVALTVSSHAASTLASQEVTAFSKQISLCWNLPAAYIRNSNFSVAASVQLNKDGSLKNKPVVTELKGFTGVPSFLMRNAARKAIEDCAPYKLPIENMRLGKKLQSHFAHKTV